MIPGLAILRSPITWAVLVGAFAIGGVWWLASSRYAAGLEAGKAEIRAEWTAASLKAAQDKRAAEQAVEAAAARAERQHQAEIDQAKTEAQEMIDAYRAELAAQPADGRCALTDADVRRMRDIRSGRSAAP